MLITQSGNNSQKFLITGQADLWGKLNISVVSEGWYKAVQFPSFAISKAGLTNIRHAAFAAVPLVIFIFQDQRLHILKYIYIYR